MKRIGLRQLAFSFGGDPILDSVEATCEAGQFVAILGASGCGKSTLLRLVAGLLNPTQGEILIDDQPVHGDHRASFVFQQPTLLPWLSVVDNVQLPLKLASTPHEVRRSQALAAIRLVGLSSEDCQKLPRQLSGGMQMRTSLARALVTQPQLLLLDEPFSALDEVLRQQLAETTLQLWAQQRWTAILVTHNVAEAVFMSQRIFILAGRPARIVATVDVPFGSRDDDLRTSVEYAQLIAQVSQRLRQAVEAR